MRAGLFAGEPLVHFSSVTYFHNGNDKLFIDNFVNDSVIALPGTISFLARQFFAAIGVRIIYQVVNALQNG